MSSLVYREQLPQPAWRQHVECLWSIETRAATLNPVPPDGCVDIVYSPALGLRIVGAMTISQEFTLAAKSHLAGIRFHPGMAGSFVATDLSSLTNMFENGESLWPELYRRLGDGGSADELLRVLAGGVATVPQALNDVQRALAFIRVSRGVVRLDDVIRQTGLSSRQFRRRVLEKAGSLLNASAASCAFAGHASWRWRLRRRIGRRLP